MQAPSPNKAGPSRAKAPVSGNKRLFNREQLAQKTQLVSKMRQPFQNILHNFPELSEKMLQEKRITLHVALTEACVHSNCITMALFVILERFHRADSTLPHHFPYPFLDEKLCEQINGIINEGMKDVPVCVWNPQEKRKLEGSCAPLHKNLAEYFRRNPGWELYDNQDGKENYESYGRKENKSFMRVISKRIESAVEKLAEETRQKVAGDNGQTDLQHAVFLRDEDVEIPTLHFQLSQDSIDLEELERGFDEVDAVEEFEKEGLF